MTLLDARVFLDADDRWRNPLDVEGRPRIYTTREGAACAMMHSAKQLLTLAQVEHRRAIESPEPEVVQAVAMAPHGQVRVPVLGETANDDAKAEGGRAGGSTGDGIECSEAIVDDASPKVRREFAKVLLRHADELLDRSDAVNAAFRLGMPLHEIEAYLDSLDNQGVGR